MHQEQPAVGHLQRSVRDGDPAHARTHVSFSAADHALGVIERIVQERRDACIDGGEHGHAWIRPDARSYCIEMHDPAAFFAVATPAIRVSQRLPSPSAAWRPLEDLLWIAAFHASRGRLLDRCSPFDVVQFTHWPNFTRLPHNSSAMRLTALLVRAPITISLAYRLLHVPVEHACQLYSAAAAAGIARVVSAAPTDVEAAPISASRRVSGFWQKMLDRFSGL
jgi:hypothetical protein